MRIGSPSRAPCRTSTTPSPTALRSTSTLPVTGSLRRTRYRFKNFPELVLTSPQSQWLANKEPMLAFLEEANKMVRGVVTDRVSLQP